MREDGVLRSAFASLQRDFNVDEPEWLVEDDFEIKLEKLRAFLRHRVLALLRTRKDHLLGILYRIDVDERSTRAALSAADDEIRASLLTDLIIDRQLRKAKTRMDFREPPAS